MSGITREKLYKVDTYDGDTSKNKSKEDAEKIIAKALYNKSFSDTIGKIIDYEIPLKINKKR